MATDKTSYTRRRSPRTFSTQHCWGYPNHSFGLKKHNCARDDKRRSLSTPRPPTRRNPKDMPNNHKLPSRSASVEPNQSSFIMKELTYPEYAPDLDAVITKLTENSQPTNSLAEGDEDDDDEMLESDEELSALLKETTYLKLDDQDYLQFSLRITEDIIRNDLYTYKDMKQIFKSHINANMDKLDMDKMLCQLINLCKEINIPFDPEEFLVGKTNEESVIEKCTRCNKKMLQEIPSSTLTDDLRDLDQMLGDEDSSQSYLNETKWIHKKRPNISISTRGLLSVDHIKPTDFKEETNMNSCVCNELKKREISLVKQSILSLKSKGASTKMQSDRYAPSEQEKLKPDKHTLINQASPVRYGSIDKVKPERYRSDRRKPVRQIVNQGTPNDQRRPDRKILRDKGTQDTCATIDQVQMKEKELIESMEPSQQEKRLSVDAMLPSVSERTEPVSSVASESFGVLAPPAEPANSPSPTHSPSKSASPIRSPAKPSSPIRSLAKSNTPTLLIKGPDDKEREYIRLKGPVYILKSDLLSKSVTDTEKPEEARSSSSEIPDKSVTPLKNVCIVMPVKSETESNVSVDEEQDDHQKQFLKANDSLALGAFKPQRIEEEEDEEEIDVPEKEISTYHYLMVDVSTETKKCLDMNAKEISFGLKGYRDDLLMGTDYNVKEELDDLSSLLQMRLSNFYPTVATQTCSADMLPVVESKKELRVILDVEEPSEREREESVITGVSTEEIVLHVPSEIPEELKPMIHESSNNSESEEEENYEKQPSVTQAPPTKTSIAKTPTPPPAGFADVRFIKDPEHDAQNVESKQKSSVVSEMSEDSEESEGNRAEQPETDSVTSIRDEHFESSMAVDHIVHPDEEKTERSLSGKHLSFLPKTDSKTTSDTSKRVRHKDAEVTIPEPSIEEEEEENKDDDTPPAETISLPSLHSIGELGLNSILNKEKEPPHPIRKETSAETNRSSKTITPLMPEPKSFNSEDSFGMNVAQDENKDDDKMDDENIMKEEVEIHVEEQKPLTKEDKVLAKLSYIPSVNMTDSMEEQVKKVVVQVEKFRQIDGGIQEHALKDMLEAEDKYKIPLVVDETNEALPRINKKTEVNPLIKDLEESKKVLCFTIKNKKQPVVKNKPDTDLITKMKSKTNIEPSPPKADTKLENMISEEEEEPKTVHYSDSPLPQENVDEPETTTIVKPSRTNIMTMPSEEAIPSTSHMQF